MSEVVNRFSISLRQVQDFEFLVKLDQSMGELRMDETPPLGKGSAISATRALAAALGNCLAASLLFASRKAGLPIEGMEGLVEVELTRNERRRIRIGRISVTLDPKFADEYIDKARATREMFEDFCTVTQSVRQGIPVEVKVRGIDGE